MQNHLENSEVRFNDHLNRMTWQALMMMIIIMTWQCRLCQLLSHFGKNFRNSTKSLTCQLVIIMHVQVRTSIAAMLVVIDWNSESPQPQFVHRVHIEAPIALHSCRMHNSKWPAAVSPQAVNASQCIPHCFKLFMHTSSSCSCSVLQVVYAWKAPQWAARIQMLLEVEVACCFLVSPKTLQRPGTLSAHPQARCAPSML